MLQAALAPACPSPSLLPSPRPALVPPSLRLGAHLLLSLDHLVDVLIVAVHTTTAGCCLVVLAVVASFPLLALLAVLLLPLGLDGAEVEELVEEQLGLRGKGEGVCEKACRGKCEL